MELMEVTDNITDKSFPPDLIREFRAVSLYTNLSGGGIDTEVGVYYPLF